MRGVAMMDVQLRVSTAPRGGPARAPLHLQLALFVSVLTESSPAQSWPPQKNAAGVVFFLALVDHGLGAAGSTGADRLSAAVSSGTARSALLAALAREPMPQGLLRVDALQLTLPPLAGTSPSFAAGAAGNFAFGSSGARGGSAPTASFARVSEEDEESSQKPGRMARIALERVGSAAGSFTEADFYDGSVHTGYWKSTSAARDFSLSRSSSANSIDERHSAAAASAMAERATACV